MKSLDEIKDEYAINEGYDNYLDYCNCLTLSDGEWESICKTYTDQILEFAITKIQKISSRNPIADSINYLEVIRRNIE